MDFDYRKANGLYVVLRYRRFFSLMEVCLVLSFSRETYHLVDCMS